MNNMTAMRQQQTSTDNRQQQTTTEVDLMRSAHLMGNAGNSLKIFRCEECSTEVIVQRVEKLRKYVLDCRKL